MDSNLVGVSIYIYQPHLLIIFYVHNVVHHSPMHAAIVVVPINAHNGMATLPSRRPSLTNFAASVVFCHRECIRNPTIHQTKTSPSKLAKKSFRVCSSIHRTGFYCSVFYQWAPSTHYTHFYNCVASEMKSKDENVNLWDFNAANRLYSLLGTIWLNV